MGPVQDARAGNERAAMADVSPTYEDIIGSLRRAPPDRPFVVGQLGQSLDGRIATVTGSSRYINGSCALDHLHVLRANVDAVLVGAGTVVADDPQLNVRRTAGRSPARVVLDPSGRTPTHGRWLADDGARRIVICARDIPRPPGCDEVIVIERVEGRVDPHRVCAALFERGLRRILVEGGARTISTFIEARAMDRLHVLVAPVIIGSGKPGLELPPVREVQDALRPPVRVWPFADGDVLFDCDLRG